MAASCREYGHAFHAFADDWGLTGHEPDFSAYRRRLIDEEKKTPAVAAVAAGRRAHRLAFAMLRSQEPYDPERWRASLAPKRPHAGR